MLDDSRSSRSHRDHPREGGGSSGGGGRDNRQDRPHSGGGDRQNQPPREQGAQGVGPNPQGSGPNPQVVDRVTPVVTTARRSICIQAMPLVERALQVLEQREVRPQLGLLKSTMLQLDSSFSERAYRRGVVHRFHRKTSQERSDPGHRRRRPLHDFAQARRGFGEDGAAGRGPAVPPPMCWKIIGTELEEGVTAADLQQWVAEESPAFDWKAYGFQEFSEFLNFSQDKTVVRIVPDETQGLLVYLGAEFHPPAVPEPEPLPLPDETEEDEGPQPVVPGQPTAGSERPKKGARKTTGQEVDGNVVTPPKRARAEVFGASKAPSAFSLGQGLIVGMTGQGLCGAAVRFLLP